MKLSYIFVIEEKPKTEEPAQQKEAEEKPAEAETSEAKPEASEDIVDGVVKGEAKGKSNVVY